MEKADKMSRDILWRAFCAGFASSCEGWNSEYPYNFHYPGILNDKRKKAEVLSVLKKNFESFLEGENRNEFSAGEFLNDADSEV